MHAPAISAAPEATAADGVLQPAGMYKAAELDETARDAQMFGALYHPSNPFDAWFCKACGVFGRGISCWCCEASGVERQWIPRFGGGAETVTWSTDGVPGDARSPWGYQAS